MLLMSECDACTGKGNADLQDLCRCRLDPLDTAPFLGKEVERYTKKQRGQHDRRAVTDGQKTAAMATVAVSSMPGARLNGNARCRVDFIQMIRKSHER